ncbi:MAG: nucleotidyltransferase domain-containing protein [Candidatus Nanoarchaeia archaeon]|nr:nucleotidyltransferase domain-containing protein [Candidatus Nanoarchaeia archaeon]
MDVLKLAKPTKREQIRTQKIVDKFLNKLNRRLVGATAIVGGSFAKNTWLSGDHDIDIFVLFSKKHDNEKISSVLENTLRQVFLFIKKIAGSRDYFQIKYKGCLFEVIPVLKIDNPEEAKNIMDISPMHVTWVKEHINGKEDDVRKLKLFLKANHCYGAESYIKGFSGYVAEILTIYYGSFDRVIESAVDWQEFDIIDTKKRKIMLRNVDKSKISPLVVIDPIQKERNAAAALSKEKFNLFIKACNEYVKSYSQEFFIKKYKIPENAIVLQAKPLKGRKDIVGVKLLKAYEYIKDKLDEDFGVEDSSWYWNKKAIFWYVTEDKEISEFKKHYGPHISDEYNLEKFREKWKDEKIMAESGRVFINVKRKHTKVRSYLQELLKDNEVKDKVKSIKIIK